MRRVLLIAPALMLIAGCATTHTPEHAPSPSVVSPSSTERPRGAPETRDDLPQVLLVGDSISLGYTPHVKRMLKDRAVVKHHQGNAGPTGRGLNHLDAWLGDGDWDVIHFNWGLHDLCYRHPDAKVQGNRDKVNGALTTTLEDYETNLDELVVRLKKTGAKLIWAHTTVVPEGEAGRNVGDDKRYNEVADEVMKRHGVAVNDLYFLTKGFSAELFVRPGNVHFTEEGYKKLSAQVADRILTAIESATQN